MRKAKTILVFLTAMTMTAGAMGVTAYAVEDGITQYDINNKAYIEKVDSFQGTIPMEKEFVEYLNSIAQPVGFSEDGENFTYGMPNTTKHIYKECDSCILDSATNGKKVMIVVTENEDLQKRRNFSTTTYYIDANHFRNNDELMSKYTVEEMNDYLNEQGLKAHLKKELFEGNGKYYYNLYCDDFSEENVLGTVLALGKKYGAELVGESLVSSEEYYYNETGTIKGDADVNGTVDLADLTTVAKYNLNNETYPLANDTAYANADMNGDGVVDGLDASALIEDQLGKK